jgi:hypothetical protein
MDDELPLELEITVAGHITTLARYLAECVRTDAEIRAWRIRYPESADKSDKIL